MEVAIRTRRLVKRFGDVHAVDGLDLEVPRGRVFAFLGPNGAGKTTTLHLLLGLLKPDAGEATVLGQDIAREPLKIRRRTGVLLEHDGVYERLTVQDNLDIWGRLHGLPWNQRNVRARHLLEDLGLHERRRSRVRELSRGMKRKLAIARALLPEGELVILDEPTVGLDPRSIVEIRDRLRSLAREKGTTVFLTTHNITEAERIADHVAVVHQGRVIATGTPTELAREHGASRALILGRHLTPGLADELARTPGILAAETQGAGDTLRLRLTRETPLAPILTRIVEHGSHIEATRREPESLEDVFLSITQNATDRPGTAAVDPPRDDDRRPRIKATHSTPELRP